MPGLFVYGSNGIRRLPNGAKGQAGKALALAAYSSFTGGTLSAIMLLIAAPALASVSLSFQVF